MIHLLSICCFVLINTSELCLMNIVVEHRSLANECEIYLKINHHKHIEYDHIIDWYIFTEYFSRLNSGQY